MEHFISKETFIDDDGLIQTFYYYNEDITEDELCELHPNLLTALNMGVKYRNGYKLVFSYNNNN